MKGKSETISRSKHILLIAIGVIIAMGLCFMLSAQTGKAYAATGDVVTDVEGNKLEGNYNGLDWKIVETDDGQELQLGEDGNPQTLEGNRNVFQDDRTQAHTHDLNDVEVKHRQEVRARWPWLSADDIDVPNPITSIKVLGEVKATGSIAFMFSGLENLKTIEGLENIDTTDVTDMAFLFGYWLTLGSFEEWPFYSSDSITSLDLSSWETSNVKNMQSMFAGLMNLNEVKGLMNLNEDKNIDSFDVGQVENFEAMFANTGFTTLDLTNWDTKNLKSFDLMFWNMSKVTSLDLSGWNVKDVKRFVNVFNNCIKLKSLNLSDWDTSNNNNMQGLFTYCRKLESIQGIEKFNTSNVTSMRATFMHCNVLEGPLDLSKWDTGNVTDMTATFAFCWKLSGLNLSGWDISNVTRTTNMFNSCIELEGIKGIEDFDTSKAQTVDYMFANTPKLDNLAPLSFDLGAAQNASNMFKKCDGIVDKLDGMSKSDQYSPATQAKLADAKAKFEELSDADTTTTTEQVKAALLIIASELRDAAREDAQRALDAANSPEVVEAANNASSATKKAYDDAKAELEALIADPNSTANDINKAIDALNDAIEGLAEKSVAEKAADAAKKAYEDARKKAAEEAAKNPGSDAAVKAAEEATAKAKNFQKAAEDWVKAAEATGNQAEIKAAKTMKDEADKAVADATKLEADQKIKRAEKNPSEANKKAAQDAANKALDAAKATNDPARIAAAQNLVTKANGLSTVGKGLVGTTFVYAQNTYMITVAPGATWDGEVTFIQAKNKRSVAVPKTAKFENKTYEVTRVGARSFRSKKIRTVSIGANVEKINAKAFQKSKAKTLIVRTKALTKARVKGSLKGSKIKTVKVKVGSKKVNKKYVKKYKKIFTKKNAGKKVKVKR